MFPFLWIIKNCTSDHSLTFFYFSAVIKYVLMYNIHTKNFNERSKEPVLNGLLRHFVAAACTGNCSYLLSLYLKL